MLYHRGWYSAVDVASSSLGCSLLTKHPDNDDLYLVNLDPQIVELLQEAKHLQKMNLEVNDTASALCQQEAHITAIRDSCVYCTLRCISNILYTLIHHEDRHVSIRKNAGRQKTDKHTSTILLYSVNSTAYA